MSGTHMMNTTTVTACVLLSTVMLHGCASETTTSTAPPAETKAVDRDLATMKASQLFDQRARAAASPQVRDQFIAVLAEKSLPDDVQGFECAVLQAMLISQRDDKPIDPMPLLKRSAAQDGMQTKVGSELLDVLATARPADLAPHADVVRALVATLSDGKASAAIILKLDTLVDVARVALPEQEATAAHTAALACVKATIAKNTATAATLRDEKNAEAKGSKEAKDTAKKLARVELSQLGLRRTLRRLESAAGRGELTGRTAPELHCEWVRNADGSTPWNQLSDLRGKIVVIDFWATWCGPCKQIMPVIQSISEEFKDKGVAVFGVNTWEKKDGVVKAKTYMESKKYTYGCLLAGEELAKTYGITGIPTLILINKDGTIALAEIGAAGDTKKMLQEAITAALAK